MTREKVKTVSTFEAEQQRKVSLGARVKFAEFDSEIGDLMADFALNEGYMDFLLNRLNLPMPLTLDARLEVLREHAVKVGETVYLMQIRRTMWQAVQHAERKRQEKKRAALSLQEAKSASATLPKDTPKRATAAVPRSGSPPVKSSPLPSSHAKTGTPPATAKTPAKSNTSGYDGVERRKQQSEYTGPERRKRQADRRSSMDRRGYPEGVAVNKRSSSDRRKKNGGRRKTDRESLM